MEILDLVQKYINTDIQTVINEMYKNNCAPQLIHDTVQLLKLKDTVEELKKNPDEWIRKYQVETDDPCTMEQIRNLIQVTRNESEYSSSYSQIVNCGLFPESLHYNFRCKKLPCNVFTGNHELIHRKDDVVIEECCSKEYIDNFKRKIKKYPSVENPIIVLMCGCSGSGKSTVANAIRERLNAVSFCLDDMITEFYFSKPYGKLRPIWTEVFSELIFLAMEEQKNIVIDDMNTKQSIRSSRVNELRGHMKENMNLVEIYMDTPLEECLRRNSGRGKYINEDYIRQIYEDLERPTLDSEGVDAIITNHYDETSKSYTVSVESRNEAFKDELKDIVETIELVNGRNKIINTEERMNEIKTILNQSPQIPQKEI